MTNLDRTSVPSHVWLFEGAKGGAWLKKFKDELEENETRESVAEPSSRVTTDTKTPSGTPDGTKMKKRKRK